MGARKQYHFWPGETGLDAWDVDRLIALSASFDVAELDLSSIPSLIWEIDTGYWFDERDKPKVRNVIEHTRLIQRWTSREGATTVRGHEFGVGLEDAAALADGLEPTVEVSRPGAVPLASSRLFAGASLTTASAVTATAASASTALVAL